MTKLVVELPVFCGTIEAPSSKSHTLRAFMCASLAKEPSYITAPLISADTKSAMQVLCRLGVKMKTIGQSPLVLEVTPPIGGLLSFASTAAQRVAVQNDKAAQRNDAHRNDRNGIVFGVGTETVLDLGNSGSLLYFLGMIFAAASSPVCLTGDASLRSRPVEPLLAVYRQAGISYSAAKNINETFAVPPLRFCGPLNAGDFQFTGPFSQPVTGILLTAPLLDGVSRIIFNRAGERPYIKMTCDWLRTAGIDFLHRGECYFEVAGRQQYHAFSKTVPGDWSSALFPLAAAVICNTALTLTNLDIADTQGDSQALSVLQVMGADIRSNAERRSISVFPVSGELKGGCFDCTDIPDSVPILAAVAVFCTGETLLLNAGGCRFKECDRLCAVAEELAQFGARITEGKDFLRIEGMGGKGLHPARVNSRGDHRIAMTLAVAACGIAAKYYAAGSCVERSVIEDFDCVKISYPRFVEDMNAAGAAFNVIG